MIADQKSDRQCLVKPAMHKVNILGKRYQYRLALSGVIVTAKIEGGLESEGMTYFRAADPYLKSADL